MYAVDFAVREQVPLAPMTTLGVGGPARYFARAESREAVFEAVVWAAERQVSLFVLGGGSNLLVGDAGFEGLVLRVAITGGDYQPTGGAVEVTVGAGENWSRLVAEAVRRGWAGIECLAGIPGMVGATPIQNVGAYGQEVRETIARVEALDLVGGRTVTFSNEECAFGYRASRFKQADRGRYVVLSVTYKLHPDGAPAIRYAELERLLAERGISRPSLADVRTAVLEIRRQKSMVVDPHDPNTRSAGSFFVNPVVTADVFTALHESETPRLAPGEHIPYFTLADGRVKLPAAWLIERVGFGRGYARGSVGISDKHTLALVNRGGATAADVLALARDIRARVHDRFGILLAPEPVFLGVTIEDTSAH